VGNKRNRNKPELVTPENLKEKVLKDMKVAGFDPAQMTEFELALLVQIGAMKNEVVDAVDELGAMLEDVLAPEDMEAGG